MQWKKQLQQILDYVENHLQRSEEPLDPDEIANIAGCSYNFFLKVFSYITGVSFSDYIRNRRLTLAGFDLKNTNIKVAEVSYKYCYDSPTSFTKAFQLFHGVTPREAKSGNQQLQVYPKMQVTSKQEYSWNIVSKPPMRLVGKKIQVPIQDDRMIEKIVEYWNQCFKDGTYLQLIKLDKEEVKGLFGLYTNYNFLQSVADYIIAVRSNEFIDDLDVIDIPATSWAIFECYGAEPKATQNCWKFIEDEWLINYPMKKIDCPELEWFSDGNSFSDDFHSQVWVPIDREE
ncbi:MAG: helix-turn-helix domain-containing protein [Anaerorhabdus sp.]|jgi:AraC family transcriptional regulator